MSFDKDELEDFLSKVEDANKTVHTNYFRLTS